MYSSQYTDLQEIRYVFKHKSNTYTVFLREIELYNQMSMG